MLMLRTQRFSSPPIQRYVWSACLSIKLSAKGQFLFFLKRCTVYTTVPLTDETWATLLDFWLAENVNFKFNQKACLAN